MGNIFWIMLLLLNWNGKVMGTDENIPIFQTQSHNASSIHELLHNATDTEATTLSMDLTTQSIKNQLEKPNNFSCNGDGSNCTSDQQQSFSFYELSKQSHHQTTSFPEILEMTDSIGNLSFTTEDPETTTMTSEFVTKSSSMFIEEDTSSESAFSPDIDHNNPLNISIEEQRNSSTHPPHLQLSSLNTDYTNIMFEVSTEKNSFYLNSTTNISLYNITSSESPTEGMDLYPLTEATTTFIIEIENKNIKNESEKEGESSIHPMTEMLTFSENTNSSQNSDVITSTSFSVNDWDSLSHTNLTEAKYYSPPTSSTKYQTSTVQEIFQSINKSKSEEASAKTYNLLSSTSPKSFFEPQDDQPKENQFSSLTTKNNSKQEFDISTVVQPTTATISNLTSSVSSFSSNEMTSEHTDQSNSSESKLSQILPKQNWKSTVEPVYISLEQSTTEQTSVENKVSLLPISTTVVSFDYNQQKEFLFKHVNNLTDIQRKSRTVEITFASSVGTVEWFHSYDKKFRTTIASLLNDTNGNQTIQSINIVYIAPTPTKNDNYFCVNFVVQSSLYEDGYEQGEKIADILNKWTTHLTKMIHLPVESVMIGFNQSDKCHKSSEMLQGSIVIQIVTAVVITSVAVAAIIAIIYVRIRKFKTITHEINSPTEQIETWGTSGRPSNGHFKDNYKAKDLDGNIIRKVYKRKQLQPETTSSTSPQRLEIVLVHNDDNLNLESCDEENVNQTFMEDTRL